MQSVTDFITVRMTSLSFLNQEIEANETIISESHRNSLDLNRLCDANDDYDEILFYPEREIILRDGEYVLAIPPPKEIVQ